MDLWAYSNGVILDFSRRGKPTDNAAIESFNGRFREECSLALMVLKTLSAMGPQHGYGIARRIEQTSDDLLSINEGTLYPVLLRLEQDGAIGSQWGVSENNRRAKFYKITRIGQKQLEAEVSQWTQANDIVGRFIALKGTKA